jgi:hypothetical protein
LHAGCPSAIVAQKITTSDLQNGSVCPGVITFTCETRGSYAIAWSSDEYIGSGGNQLTFAAGASHVGEILRSGSIAQTMANFTYNTDENGKLVMVSILTITIVPNSPGGSVTCTHIGDGTTDSIDFEVIGKIKNNITILNITCH